MIFSLDIAGIHGQFRESEPKEPVYITEEYLLPYLRYMRDHKRLFRAAVKNSAALEFDETYRHIFDPILAQFLIPEGQRACVMIFYLSSINAVVTQWLENDCAESLEEIGKNIMDCVLH